MGVGDRLLRLGDHRGIRVIGGVVDHYHGTVGFSDLINNAGGGGYQI